MTDGKINTLQFKLLTHEKAVDIANYSIPSKDSNVDQPTEESSSGTTKKKTKSKTKPKKRGDSNKENEQARNNIPVAE